MEKNSCQFQLVEGIPNRAEFKQLEKLYYSIFEDAQLQFFKQRIQEKENICSLLVFYNKKPIGFKIGYKYNETTFYSWVGGILPDFRKKGIGKKLAHLQENWAKENSYLKLRTKSMNKFKPMMILNLKNGFDIVSVYTNSTNQTKIVFEKKLS